VVAPKPRAWVLDSLFDGVVPQAKFATTLRGPDLGSLAMQAFTGRLTVHGVSVDYLRPMPLIRNGHATVDFSPDRLDIAVSAGGVNGLKITRGSVIITGLDKEDQFASIDLDIIGSVDDALKLVDSEPLGYPSALGLKPSSAGGQAGVHLLLKMPLAVDLKLDDITVNVDADLRDLSLADLAFGHSLTGGNVRLRVDRHGLDASGTAALGGAPTTLEWHENFEPTTPFRSRYHVKGVLDDRQRAAFQLDFPPLVPPFLTGPVKADVLATIGHEGRGVLTVEADLRAAAMKLPGLNWAKPADKPAEAGALVRFTKAGLLDVPRFTAHAGDDLEVAGRVALTEASTLQRVTLERFKLGRSNVHGTLEPRDGGLAIALNGPVFDLAHTLGESAGEDSAPPASEPPPPPLAIDLAVDRLWTSQEGYVENATARLERVEGQWRTGSLGATLVDGRPLTGKLETGRLETGKLETGAGARTFSLTCDDAGGVLRAFGIFDNMVGGKLTVDGTVEADDSLKGKAEVSSYRVVKAPLLARLLTVAALTGIVESLTGDGLRFTVLELPFTHANGVLYVRDAQAHGPSLGLTAKGRVALRSEQIDIEGTVIPAYLLNSLIGNLPLLGDLLTGAKGGGIFAATYSMRGPMGDPDITVNPLAVLAPGFLRNLFDIFHIFDPEEEPEPPVKPKGE
ncbi:MAG: AsmA-like C-terminal domain-containing protein, partial [Alphaproteobacteria bacterium]